MSEVKNAATIIISRARAKAALSQVLFELGFEIPGKSCNDIADILIAAMLENTGYLK